MSESTDIPVREESAAEILAEVYEEPVERFQAPADIELPDIEELESVPPGERSRNDIDDF